MKDTGETLVRALRDKIIELEQATRDLSDREARLRAIFDTEPECVKLLSADGRLLEMNPAGLRMVEADSFEQVKNQSIYSLVMEEDRDAVRELTAKVFRGESGTLEYRMVGLKGTALWLDTHVSPLRDASGAIVALLGITRDITERMQTEAALREKERLLSESQRIAHIGSWLLDLTGKVTCSEETYRMFGISHAQDLPSFLKLAHPEDQPVVQAWIDACIAGQAPGELEARAILPDGRLRYLSGRGELRTDAEHRPTHITGTVQDITERKLSELQAQRLNRALRDSEERFRDLVDTIEDVFWIAVPDPRRVLYVSPAYEKVWGRTCDSLYASPQSWSDAIHPEDRARVVQAATTRQALGEYDEEYRILRPDGDVRWIRDRAFPVRSADGRIARLVGIARDITERRATQEQLRQSQKMESIGRLAAGIAHDFNNMLTVISGVAELAETGLPDGAPLREDFAAIRDAGTKAAELTRQLLAFSRKQVLRPEVVNLNAVVSETEALLRRALGERVRLVVRLDGDLEPVEVDPQQFHQVILNLAINGRDAMPHGGTLTIETGNVAPGSPDTGSQIALQHERCVMLAVSDTGLGMDASTQQWIFEPFFTTKDVGKGTGLGLATVHGIVTQSGGDIRVESEVGKGTSFKIYLPVTDEPALVPSDVPVQDSPRGAECVLVVDDDSGVRRLASRMLEKAGYAVLVAGGGDEALQLLDRHRGPLHLVLTDVVMPGMGGRQLAERIMRRRPGVKILFMSGYTEDGVLGDGLLKAGVQLIGKPYSAAGLARKVREVLDS